MRYLSFTALIFCILFPSVLYISSVQVMEKQLKAQYTQEVERVYMGNTKALLSGNIRLKDSINRNITRFLYSKALLTYGVKLDITVSTNGGKILYPVAFGGEQDRDFLSDDPTKIAADNYALMNEGLVLTISVNIDYNSPVSYLILSFFIMVAIVILFVIYRAGSKKQKQFDYEKNKKIERLVKLEKAYAARLVALAKKREAIESKYKEINEELDNEKKKADKNEDEFINEIVELEEEIKNKQALHGEQQEEIECLKTKITELEEKLNKGKGHLSKGKDVQTKRLDALYKNILINKRAVSGFMDLGDEMKIKAEEVIHQLNDSPDIVQIKRKVFSKKSRETVFEVIFAYRGRLYYRKLKGDRIEILIIGTKNSQVKDLEYLDSL